MRHNLHVSLILSYIAGNHSRQNQFVSLSDFVLRYTQSLLSGCQSAVKSMAYCNMVRSGMTASGRSLTKPFCTGTGLRHLRNTAVVSRAHSRRQLSAMAQGQATYDIWVKGSPEKNELGDCKPISLCPWPRFSVLVTVFPDARHPALIKAKYAVSSQAHSRTV